MRLVRYSVGNHPPVAGLLVDGHVHALVDLVPGAPSNMLDVIADWDRIRATVVRAGFPARGTPLQDVTLRAPIERPGKILALGLNYADHIKEAEQSGLKIPTQQI